MCKLNSLLLLMSCLIFIRNDVVSYDVDQEDPNPRNLHINDLLRFIGIPLTYPITPASYQELFQEVKRMLVLSVKDINQIKTDCQCLNRSLPTTLIGWKKIFRSLMLKYDKPLKLLMMLDISTIPCTKSAFDNFIKAIRASECGLLPSIKIMIEQCEQCEQTGALQKKRERIAMFNQFADACIKDDVVKQFLFAFGYSSVNYSDPKDIKSVINGMANNFEPVIEEIKSVRCARYLRHCLELFAGQPVDERTTFNTITSRITKLYSERTNNLMSIVERVFKNWNNTVGQTSAYNDLRKFPIYNERYQDKLSSELSVDFLNAILRFRNAKNADEAIKTLKDDAKIWELRLVSEQQSNPCYKLSEIDRKAVNYLARVTLTLFMYKNADMLIDVSKCATILSCYQYEGASLQDKYNQCLVVLIYCKNDAIGKVRKQILNLWPDKADIPTKYINFCVIYSGLWNTVSDRMFHGVVENRKSRIVEICEPDSAAFTRLMKLIVGTGDDYKNVATLMWNWFCYIWQHRKSYYCLSFV